MILQNGERLMNEIILNLLTRRSCRNFSPRPVDESDLAQIITAAKFAPTAMNNQSYHFTVVRESDVLAEISAVNRKLLSADYIKRVETRMANKPFSNFYHAPVVIFISSEDVPFGVADAANAAENICLAAHSLNLGSCYIASFLPAFDGEEAPRLKSLLQLPANQIPRFAVAIGYPEGSAPEAPARKEDNVTFIG